MIRTNLSSLIQAKISNLLARICIFIFLLSIVVVINSCKKNPEYKPEPLPVINPTVNPIPYSVVAYLITPTDKTINPDYYRAAKKALLNLQGWYKAQMGNNKTFVLNPVVLDTLTALHNSTWFTENHGDSISGTNTFYNNTKCELKQLLGPKFDTSLYAYFAFVDANFYNTTVPRGLAVEGSNSLGGLASSFPDGWTGDAGHALGHAFGLIDAVPANADGLMSKGWSRYPNCVLKPVELDSLNAIPFFKVQ